MAYRGETFAVNLSAGGFDNDLNIDKIPITQMVPTTRNINLTKGSRSKRGGTSRVNAAAITGTPRIWGVYQFRLQNGTEFILTATSDGKIQKNYTAEIKTGLTINKPVHFVTFNNLCIICTGNDLPQVWDGAAGTTSNIASPAADWSAGNHPHKMIVHGKGASERLWAIKGKTDANTVYYSSVNAGDGGTTAPTFGVGGTTDGDFYIETADGFGIINGVEYGDSLILSGKSWMYIIDDESLTLAEWGYNKAQWEGGTANDRSLIPVSNDIISLTEDGVLYSVTTAQEKGDYKLASLTRTSPLGTPFMDEYIKNNIKLSAIDDFHMIYDPVLRQVYIFCVRTGQTNVDTALCYFIDRGPVDGWMIKDNIDTASGFKASASALVRVAAGDNRIYTGGWNDGFVWRLEDTTKNDNGNSYLSGFKTPRSNVGDPRLTKRFDQVRMLVEAKGNYDLFVDILIDDAILRRRTINLTSGATYGSAQYGTQVYSSGDVIEKMLPVNAVGKRIQIHAYNNNANEDFLVSQILIDFKPLGRLVA